MTEEGVNGVSLSEVARRLGVKPPSIYKYFDSLLAIYDALFEHGQRTHLEIMRTAMARAEPGLDALAAGLEAMATSVEMVRLQRQALANAAAAGQLGAGADSDEALWVTSVLISGVIGQAIANQPGDAFGRHRRAGEQHITTAQNSSSPRVVEAHRTPHLALLRAGDPGSKP